jgi:gliding motility-associated-like protein
MGVLRRVLLLLLWGLPGGAWASHIVGGNFEMTYNGRPGSYSLALSLFFDEINGRQNAVQQNITVSIFRKSDNWRMLDVPMSLQTRTAVVYANEACAAARSLRTSDIRYLGQMNVNPALFDDPGGYYLVWDNCCRNAVITNIRNPSRVGMTFYLEFPAMRSGGQDFLNSSPKFSTPNGDYICLGEPFKLGFGATDADGDELRYSLVTPYVGFNTGSNNDSPIPRGSSSYPTATWADGYSTSAQIQGNPALQVDGRTGLLSVTATTLGLHVFTVQVDEYRNGQRIGAVRRDFQLLVVDCPNKRLSTPPIYTASTPPEKRDMGVKTVDFCTGGFLQLFTKADPNLNYQWQRDGENIAGATLTSLLVDRPGKYVVIVSSKSECSKAGYSEETRVVGKPGPAVAITADGPTNTCADRTLTLSATTGNFTYLWSFNGDTLREATTPKLVAKATGLYGALVKSTVSDCFFRPTLAVTVNPLPTAKLTPPARTTLCQGDTIALAATDGFGYRFDWQRDGSPLTGATTGPKLTVRDGGLYTVRVTDENNCSARSDSVKFVFNPRPQIVFDSIPALCGSDRNVVTLRATPAGGLFSGKGVTGNTFSPQATGFGNFVLTYSAVNEFRCTAQKNRLAVVAQTPRLRLGPDLNILRGDSIRLPAESGANVTYRWTPPDHLTSASVLSPVAFPDQTTTYTLRGTLPSGCFTEDQITVTVWERVKVPNGFTPNGDGTNDVWELPGIEAYPDAEIHIYNRWGGEIFASKGYTTPFDGQFQNHRLPPATYYYVIRPNDKVPVLKGAVTILQ